MEAKMIDLVVNIYAGKLMRLVVIVNMLYEVCALCVWICALDGLRVRD